MAARWWRRSRRPDSLVGPFALRSAAVFVVVGIGLHFVVQELIERQFHDHAELHAVFVTDSVLLPELQRFAAASRLEDLRGLDTDDRAAIAATLRRLAIDDAVTHVVAWDRGGTVIAADEPELVGMRRGSYPQLFDRAVRDGTVSLDGPASYVSATSDAPTLRTFVPVGDDETLIAEVHQDWSPSLAAARTLSRTLDAGLMVGLLLLWVLLLPITRRASRRLRERSLTDELTGLGNRAALEDELERAQQRARRTGSDLGLLFVDLDDFKSVNDRHGHAAGDHVLKVVADRLRARTRQSGTIARFAGDEFVVLLEDTDLVLLEQAARRVLDAVQEPIDGLGGVRLSTSVGVVVASSTMTADALLRQADAAMYEVKQEGGDAYRVFDMDLRAVIERRNWIQRDLPGAGDRGELELVYQPFYRLRPDGRDEPVAVEALLRWSHPEHGPVSPGEFIPIAERAGMIDQIGRWVLDNACRQLAAWPWSLEPDRDFTLYVNLSALQLTPDLLPYLEACLRETGADPRRLGLEITETAVVDEDDVAIIQILHELRAYGCRVALDDFGTGYSSLGRLRAVPMDLLKLDASFIPKVTRIGTGRPSREQAIMTAIAGLAQELEITVLAEGIESAEQLETIRDLGFDLGQGYHLARPAPAASVSARFELPDALQAVAP